MNILIVHADPEPNSFVSALKNAFVERATACGHQVTISDLYAMGFNPVSGRHNFSTVAQPAVYRQQDEEAFATAHDGFVAELSTEMTKVEWAELLVFSFPMWWFGLPAILKGWVDRVIAAGRIYGGSLLYENGIGRGKRALIIATTGGPAGAYSQWGINPPLSVVLRPIQHGIFWFLGYQPLPPLVVHAPKWMTDEQRAQALLDAERYAETAETASPLRFPMLAQFPSFGALDSLSRFMVTVRRQREPDDTFAALVPAELARVAELQREGTLQFFAVAAPDDARWVGWLFFRAATANEVKTILESLPLYEYLEFTIQEAARV
jgi:NAD(P)H dehydrogenase (quinone)